MNALWVAASALACVSVVSTSAQAEPFVFQTIAVPGAEDTLVIDVNNAGHMVGVYGDFVGPIPTPGNIHHGYVFDGSTFTTIDVPTATHTVATGINEHGQIVGNFRDQTGAFHGFVLDGGVFTPIDVPGAPNTVPTRINNAGQIVGWFGDVTTFEVHGFLLDHGVFTQIDFPDAFATNVWGLNNQGQIVGAFLERGTFHGRGFLFDRGTYIPLPDVPGSILTEARGINDAGAIAGFFLDPDQFSHSFVLNNGVFTLFDPPDAAPTLVPYPGVSVALGVNDEGVIVGGFNTEDGRVLGYAAVPEPATLTLTGLGLLGAVYRRRRATRASRLVGR